MPQTVSKWPQTVRKAALISDLDKRCLRNVAPYIVASLQTRALHAKGNENLAVVKTVFSYSRITKKELQGTKYCLKYPHICLK